MELSPKRTPRPDPLNGRRDSGWDERDGRGSPPPLNRPLSLPSDSNTAGASDADSSPKASSLQRYKDVSVIKEKAERWRGRKSEGEPTDESSPEVQRRRDRRKEDFQ